MINNVHYKNHCVGTGLKPVPTGEPAADFVGTAQCAVPTVASAGQVTLEYAIIFAVMLAAIFATGIIDKSRNSFKLYLTKASDSMTVIKSADESAGDAQGSDAAITADAANNARAELARLKDTFAEERNRYEEKREQTFLGRIFMPKFENTTNGKALVSKIGAYEKVVAELSAK